MKSSESPSPAAHDISVASLLRLLPDDVDSFEKRIRQIVDAGHSSALQRVFTEAGYHGVSGVIDPLLGAMQDLPTELRSQAARRLAVEDLWQAHVQRSMEHAAAALAAASIRPCGLKGPILGRRFYAPAASRHCMDVDLLVAAADFERATAALTAAGYTSEPGESVDYLLRYSHHLGFIREGSPPLELHFRAYAGFGVTVPAELLLARARPYALNPDVSVLIPAPEDEFIYLAAHAAGHSFCRLVWLYDLKLLLHRSDSIDWDAVAVRARDAGVLSAVAYAVQLLETWLDVNPGTLPRALTKRSRRSHLADRLVDEVSRPQQRSAVENFAGLVFTSLLCDRPSRTLWQFQHHMLRAARRRLYRAAPHLVPAHWNQ
jgi:hypothetical protein